MINIFKNSLTQILPKLAVSQFIGWGISVAIDNTTLVDVAWGFNHLLFAAAVSTANFKDLGLLASNPRKMVGMFLISVWFTRLAGFIFKERIYNRHVDPRYTELAENRNMSKYFFGFIQFQTQGLLILFTGFSINYLFLNPATIIGPLGYLGIVTCLVGVIGEAIADQQLQNFKNTNTNPQAVFREGLFKKSRHPNLFFEIVFWTGISIYSLNPSNLLLSLPAFLGPISLYFIMAKLTIPITEAHMKKKRPNYDQVLRQTNKFLPF